MPYHIGDTVRVKPGTPCPDVPELDIGGWQGRVIDLAWADRPADPTIGFTFDSVSLRALPVWYLADCEEKGLDWATMYLGLDQVEPAEPRDTEQEAEQVQREIQARVGWLGIGPEGEAIQTVVNSASSTREWDVMQAWDEHLQRHLRFPFAAVVYEFQERGPLRAGDRLTVLGIEDVDDLYGVIVACRQGRQRLYVPLAYTTRVFQGLWALTLLAPTAGLTIREAALDGLARRVEDEALALGPLTRFDD